MIESFLRFSIERRFLVLSASLVIVLLGLWSVQRLPVDAVPDITNVQVQILTEAPGYSPLESEQRVTFPVETALAGLPNLEYTRSLSRYGLSQVTAVFRDGTDIYFARNLIASTLASLRSDLPPGLEPKLGPIATGLGEIFLYTVRAEPGALQPDGRPYDSTALREIQDWIIKPQLARVPGVAEVNAVGGFRKQFHVTPDPRKLLTFGVTMEEVVAALQRNNQHRGAGFVERGGEQVLVRSPGQLQGIEDIERVVVKPSKTSAELASPITIGDVAQVAIGRELRTGAATENGRETVLGTTMMLLGENSRAVAANLAKALEKAQSSLPEGVIAEPVYDRTNLVDSAIATVQKNLLEGALLVIAVLFVMLGNFRAALITAAVIPLAMLATLTGMVGTGISANLMSLGALDFGLIVDGAVIIVENTVRRLAQANHGRNTPLPLQQRLHVVFTATNEVIRPSLFGVLIITLVYIPLFSLTGVEGKMFHPMAATVVMALLAAMVFCFTLVPAALALFLRGPIRETENPVVRGAKSLYRPILQAAMQLRWLVLSMALSLVLFCGWLATTLGSEFVPQLNEGDIATHALRFPGTGLEQSVAMQKQLEEALATEPEIARIFSRIGTSEVATDPMPPNVSDTFIILKPKSEWPDPKLSRDALIQRLQQTIESVPGNNYEFTQPIQMRFNELISGVRADVAIKVFGDDLAQLRRSAQEILAVVNRIPGASDMRVEQVDALPVLSIEPKRIALAQYGLDVQALQDYVSTAIGGSRAGLMYSGDRRFDLVVRLPEPLREETEAFGSLPVGLPGGGFVPLEEIAQIRWLQAPAQVSRENGKRRVVVTANVRGRDLGSFVEEVQKSVASSVTLPAGYWLDYGGTFEQLKSASKRLSFVVPMTLLMILLLLMLAFGSLKDALIIFTGVPLALTGGVLALWLRDMPLSISAGVGFIALSGVAVLNGLVMLSFIRERWRESGELYTSIVDGAMLRLRPVLMTALVASLGFVPMALNTGTGAEVQRPLATVVMGGIISSTLLTLVVLPVLYQWVHGRLRKFSLAAVEG
ncbi:efflux RND transporter permease subunit [Microbulbifer agarilyticus]|uniref:efflux RND transporter permease subunit n=1 Tax=Microbulbifer agarilyticus TaxID=260552 RepID=UPI001C9697D3|nr:CusA/CzcA family heavy metal efflux RND transporter [Microbulbifer agarilyticus]MBY6213063.1 CusA/CzcA family heavy metal efflux RND transporter [Microbulbifer agarilyticus]MCA0894639.1 CusA/CzcA family heavy metal efflux RND transporter [Microbulbifer agarilyticus]